MASVGDHALKTESFPCEFYLHDPAETPADEAGFRTSGAPRVAWAEEASASIGQESSPPAGFRLMSGRLTEAPHREPARLKARSSASICRGVKYCRNSINAP